MNKLNNPQLQTSVNKEDEFQYFSFRGKGLELFAIFLKNILLILLTFGFYFPYAKTNLRKYFWQNTYLNNEPFEYTGNGKELLKGYIVSFVIFGGIYLLNTFMQTISSSAVLWTQLGLGLLVFYFAPYVAFNSYRYMVKRTSFRGLSFSVNPQGITEFKKNFYKLILIPLTFGLYIPFWKVSLLKTLLKNTYYGQLRLSFKGDGGDLFGIHLKYLFLNIITLGLSSSWYQANLINFKIQNISLLDGNGKKSRIETQLTGTDIFLANIAAIVVVLITLGLGTPWAILYYQKTILDRITINGAINFDELTAHTFEEKANLYGEGVDDVLFEDMNIGLGFEL